MTELKCPNCGGKQFNACGGLRQCVFCDSEFVVSAETFSPVPHLGTRNGVVDESRQIITIPDLGTCRIRHSQPGITAKDWDTLGHRWDSLHYEIGQAFLPAIKRCINLLGGTP